MRKVGKFLLGCQNVKPKVKLYTQDLQFYASYRETKLEKENFDSIAVCTEFFSIKKLKLGHTLTKVKLLKF